MFRTVFAALLSFLLLAFAANAADGNRLAYLDGPLDPYYPHRDFPKLITPQWVGEEGVECVVTLAIDDMRESAKYEAYLRPILDRLKKIDGRAAMSIMSCRVQPADPQLQAWLKEGVSIECHSYDHPCPILQDGGLSKAKGTYDHCVDLMNEIPGNKPVAFRVPCCDSKNTPSPRFWAEIFNKTTEKGNFLQIDSSVFNIITNKDKELPKEITELADGSERFRRYVPFANFVNTIEDYPYPYIIGGMCWEFPCVTPSDWSAQFVQKPNNPDTVRDWKLALDACVLKQGTFNLVFHPHGWIRNDQIVELIDHAVAKHGKKVKFLTFKECAEKLNRNLMGLELINRAEGPKKKAYLVGLDDDQYIDIAHGATSTIWLHDRLDWRSVTTRAQGFIDKHLLTTERDLDGDGKVERLKDIDGRLFVYSPDGPEVFKAPKGIAFKGYAEQPAALRIVDVNSDGKLDCLYSDDSRYCLYLFKDMKEGWATKVFDVVRGKEDAADNGSKVPVIPPFVLRDGTNNGAWFHSGALWLQNEDTWRLPDGVFKLTFAEMLGKQNAERGIQNSEKGGEGEGCCGAAEEVQGPKSTAQSEANPKSPIPNPKSDDQPLATSTSTAPPSSDARYDDLVMPPPLSPEESLKSLHVRPGMKVELVAAEPLIVDPVAFDWGPDGRLWVVEMRDYPSGITWHKEGDEFGQPGGRVKVLTDTDGDGRYDKAALFLDELPFPTGIKVWRKGILVTAAPDILYAEDTDGDDKADIKTTLYRGFGEGNQQHRVNGLRWGLDNWLHVGNGDSGGVIRRIGVPPVQSGSLAPRVSNDIAGKGERTGKTAANSRSELPTLEVNVAGRDLRIRPDTGELDTTSGNTQFGRERDDWGNWFGNNNSNPLWHYTLDDRYLRRNPHATYPPVKKDVSVVPGAAPVYPRSKTLTRFNDDNKANRYTSACGPMLYRDDLLGAEFYHNVFVCEPVHNLVSREIISPQGTTFSSRRADDEKTSEFLASDDNWFRPSMVRTGPDGAIWVADMYRFVIEHPKWIPLAAQKKLDLRAGDDKGRIYRIYPEGKQPRPIARLDKLDTAGLVAALDSPNGPQRDLAHQMLVWKADKSAAAPLTKLATESKRPQARLQALCTLDGIGELSDETILRALADDHPAVRRDSVRLAESRLAKSPALAAATLKLADDADIHVRMQVSYSLGELKTPAAANQLAHLLINERTDQYVTAAVLSSISKDSVANVLAATNIRDMRLDGGIPDRLISMAAAMGEYEAVEKAGAAILAQRDMVKAWGLVARLDDILKRDKAKSRILSASSLPIAEVLAEARRAAKGSDIPLALAAIPILARGLDDQDAGDIELLSGLLDPKHPPAINSLAAQSMARNGRLDTVMLLLAGWKSYTPSLRNQILDSLAAREEWSLALLAAVESGQVPHTQLDARRRQQFLSARSKAVRERAEKVFAAGVNPDRQKLIETYLTEAKSNRGNPAQGKFAFTKRCATCHKLSGEGHAVGPDLGPLAQRAPEYLLTSILDPNRAVEDRYLEYVALTTDGRQQSGILVEETGASLTLAAPEGKQITISRSELDQIKSSGKSLMPEGIERDVPPAEMNDILAYLKSNAPPPKQLALNKPELVQPFNDGSIRLFATNCRAYGSTIKMEETFRALGWWNSADDYCAWSFEVPQGAAGEYRATLEYSCADNSSGNTAVLEVAGQTLSGNVASSGGWDRFRGWTIGTVTLPEGTSELVVRSSGPIKNALFDLGGIRLVPVKK